MLSKLVTVLACIYSFVRHLSIFIFFLFGIPLFCQDQQLADSLESIYINGDYEEEYKLQILNDLSAYHYLSEDKIKYSNELIDLATKMDSSQYFYSAHLEKGNAYSDLGEMPKAIENFLKAGDAAIKSGDSILLGAIYGSVANIYLGMENLNSGIYYYKKSINIIENNMLVKRDTFKLASSIMNLGYLYIDQKKLDSALVYFNESGDLFKRINDSIGLAYTDLNKGAVYAEQKNYANAEASINKAFPVIEKYGHFNAMCETLIDFSEIYLDKGEIERASEFAYKSLELAIQHNLKSEISEAYRQLSDIYEKTGDEKQSLAYYKDYIIYKDSVMNLSSVQEVANMRTEFEVAQKQTEINLKQSEVELLNQQKSNLRILAISMIALLGMTGFYFRNIRKSKRRSDDLLLNILPTATAQELKEHGKVKAKKFKSVSIMFTDFQAFTKYSQKLSPEVLVKSVDYYFSKFDEIIEKYELEKIKTIGDAYMCAGGLNAEGKGHCVQIIKAAFEIAEFMKKSKVTDLGELAHFEIRIGINTGPVVAGVVGKKKFAYDIWGDSVNVASRMESNSEIGKINISENTYQLVKDEFDCQYRGEIEVKNKGLMKMYFINAPLIDSS